MFKIYTNFLLTLLMAVPTVTSAAPLKITTKSCVQALRGESQFAQKSAIDEINILVICYEGMVISKITEDKLKAIFSSRGFHNINITHRGASNSDPYETLPGQDYVLIVINDENAENYYEAWHELNDRSIPNTPKSIMNIKDVPKELNYSNNQIEAFADYVLLDSSHSSLMN